jgi:cyanophycinase
MAAHDASRPGIQGVTASPGTLALVGAGEFLPSMQTVDRELLLRSSGDRVVILPTASAPDGSIVFERWASMGVRHFQDLGARAVAVRAMSREDCGLAEIAAQIEEADLIYFSGGKPDYLFRALENTPSWQSVLRVLERGGVVAGCSAGAMILGAFIPTFRLRQLPGRTALWGPAFGLVPDSVVIPHFNEMPRAMLRAWVAIRPSGTRALGVDRASALVGRAGDWQVMGTGNVTVIDTGGATILRAGDHIA